MSQSALAARLSEPDMTALADWQAADALNAPDDALATRREPVAISRVTNLLRQRGKWLVVKAAAAEGNIGAMAAVDLNADLRTTTVDLDDPAAVQMLALMVPDVLDADDVEAVNALADVPQSWAQANGFPNGVTSRDVGLARGGQA